MTIVFNLFGTEKLTAAIAKKISGTIGHIDHHIFPDGESRVRILDNIKDKNVIIVSSLERPNEKLIPLILLLSTARDLGAKKISLITPYLCYMRQDTRFNPGEGISAKYIGNLLSRYLDSIVTVDPHLHRFSELSQAYPINNKVVHAAPAISEYIKTHIKNPLLIGPDRESEQWVADIANTISAPHLILEKKRHGDRDVEFNLPKHEDYLDHHPVLIDDIISTAATMSQAVKYLNSIGLMHKQTFSPTCIGVHAIFADDAYEILQSANPADIITCNTVEHSTNRIDVTGLIVSSITELI